MPYCRVCGVQLVDDVQYCYNCGTSVIPVDSSVVSVPVSQPVQPQQTSTTSVPNKSPLKDPLILSTLIMLIVLVVALILAAITIAHIDVGIFNTNPFDQPGVNTINFTQT